jgi:hypothetical protein
MPFTVAKTLMLGKAKALRDKAVITRKSAEQAAALLENRATSLESLAEEIPDGLTQQADTMLGEMLSNWERGLGA